MLSIVQYLFYPVRTTWQLFILRGAVFFRCGAQLLDVSGGVSKVEIRHRQLLVIVLPLAAQSNPVFINVNEHVRKFRYSPCAGKAHSVRGGSASKFAANHPVKTNKSCKCLDSSPAAFQYQFSDNTYGFSFRCLASTFPNILISHELTTKKEPRVSARLKWNESCVSTIHADSKPSSWRMSKTCYPSLQDDPD